MRWHQRRRELLPVAHGCWELSPLPRVIFSGQCVMQKELGGVLLSGGLLKLAASVQSISVAGPSKDVQEKQGGHG